MQFQFKNIFGSNRGWEAYASLDQSLKTDPINTPTNISFITWTIYIPTGVKGKLQATTFPEATINDAGTNLDTYWIDWELEDDTILDVNGYATGPVTLQGSVPVVSGLRIVRESVGPDLIELGLRGQ